MPVHVDCAGPNPIAICGIGLRLPGGISHTQDYWELLINGRDAKTQGKEQRFNPEGFDDALGGHLSIRNQNGYFLQQDLGRFDPSFFSLSRKEAERCDPQQRLLLEVTRECLEDAGETNYRGSRIGCYVGSFGSTWMRLQTVDPQFPTNYLMTGVEDYMLSNRISYEYDLAGPRQASLVALAEACAALQNGTIEGAVVAGGCLQLSPVLTEMMATEGTLSSDGSCKSFDSSANGFARAEGITAIFVKRLDDALRDGNAIRSIIRGCQSSSDGSRAGLMQPQARTQEVLMRQVYAQACVDPAETAFVECHGTGTAVGDPIETEAVNNIFGEHGVYIGSVKPNIGHCEGSAGLASLIKGVLAVEHGIIPPNIKLRNANPKIPLGHRLQVPLAPTPFPLHKKRRVSINSFGIGGSNAHVVIESFNAPVVNGVHHQDHLYDHSASNLVLLSANTKYSLDQQIRLHHEFTSRHPENIPGVAYTRALRREWLPHRAFTIMDPTGQAVMTSSAVKAPNPSSIIKTVMVFSGQGSQWIGMGKELAMAFPAFRADLAAMDQILQSLEQPPAWSLCELMSRPEGVIDAPHAVSFDAAEISQPCCTALQIALVNQFRRLGVLPAAVVGHSSGEIAAAYAAGHISLQMAIRSAYYRGLVTRRAQSLNGGMAAVGLGYEDVSRYLIDGVVVACENSPSSSTISGELSLVERVIASIKTEQPGTLAKMLKVDMAYHSHHMLRLGDEYRLLLRKSLDSEDDTFFTQGAVFISSVTGSKIEASTVNSPEYWVENLTQRVRFVSAVRNMHAMMRDSMVVLLEVGPHSTLKGPLRQIQASGYVASQKRKEDCHISLLEALGHLYQLGVRVDFEPLFMGKRALAGLPTYPWDHTGPSFWHESRISRASRFRKYPRHCLLGLRSLESPDSLPMWRNMLGVGEVQWLLDHRVGGNTVFPFAGYVAMAIEALRQTKNLRMGSGYRLRHIVASTALVLVQSKPVEVITSLRQGRLTDTQKSAWFHFQIQSHDGEQWTEHCSGEIGPSSSYPQLEQDRYSGQLPRSVPDSLFYRAMSRVGLKYGPDFALLRDIKSSVTENVAHARIAASKTPAANNYFRIHPADLDSCLQLVFVAMTQGLCRRLTQLYVPTIVEELEICDDTDSDNEPVEVQVTMGQGDYHSCRIDGFSTTGRSIFTIKGVQLASVEHDGGSEAIHKEQHGMARLEWYPAFDFADVTNGLVPPPINREHLRLEQELSFLCMVQELDMIQNVLPSKPHLLLLRNWIQRETTVALETGTFPLVNDPDRLARMDKAERLELVDSHLSTMAGGPHAPFAQACKRVLDHALAIFAGEVETIDLLTRGDLLTEVYNQNSFQYGEFVHLLAKSNPKLRILEVGAGTGGTTDLILRYLADEDGPDRGAPPFSLYTFTDISAGFFTKAKDRFSDYASNIEYRVFDASKPPSEQGLQGCEHSYDVIIAANVVHATPYLKTTLANIRSLLAPNGILLLTEPLPTLKTVNYIFGHLPGWWFGEADGRSGGPLLDVDGWDRELRASGFSGADTVVYGAKSPYRQIMTIVSHAQTKEPSIDDTHGKDVVLLCEDKSSVSSVAAALKAELERRGWSVELWDLKSHTSTLPSDSLWISCVDIEDRDFSTNYFNDVDHFDRLRDFLRQLVDRKTLWLMPPTQMGLSGEVHAAQFLGLSRSLRSELNMQLFTLEISSIEAFQEPHLVAQVFEKIQVDENDTNQTLAADMEYAVLHSQVFIPRFRPLTFESRLAELSTHQGTETGSKRAELRISQRALLNTLFWQELPSVASIPEGHVEIDNRAIGLNAFDIFSAKGLIRGDVATENLKFGCEAAGVVLRTGSGVTGLRTGDRVMFFTNGGAFATHPVVPCELVLRMPDSMSFEQAATVPVCFGTVLHSLVNVARVEEGQTVLIHSACGGVGLAAIQVCRMLGARVFLTVGSRRKVSYLMDTLGFSRNQIFSSRDTSFVDGVMRETGGAGVDVVLNSLTGELLHESWKCVAEFGCFLELGSRDSRGSGQLDMMPFSHNRSYHGIEGIQFTRRPSVWRRLCDMFLRCVEERKLQHIEPLTVFSANDVEQAFRFLDDASHIGKVALSVTPGAPPQMSPYLRSIRFDAGASYIITGGVGGLGRSIATWMVEHGARHLTFLSRTSGVSNTSKALFAELESMGCSITAVAGRVDEREDVEAAVEQSTKPVRGVLHLAMVLRDASVMDMSWAQWQEVMTPKVQGSLNLHSVLMQKKQPLDFFFVASSIISVLDATGQANYLAANAVNEAFCRHRHSLGLPASTLNICPIHDVGFVAENEHAAQSLQAQGLHAAGERELLQCLELSILQDQAPAQAQKRNGAPRASPWSYPGQLIMGLHTGQKLDDPECRVMWRRDRRMGVYHNSASPTSTGAAATSHDNMLQTLLSSWTAADALQQLKSEATIQLFAEEIGKKINEYLLRPDQAVDLESKLADMGLDSLLSVELGRWFKIAFGVRLTAIDIMASVTLRRLALATAKKLIQRYTKGKVG